MDNSFHFLLMITQASVQRSIMHRLKNTGLTPGQPMVLEYLEDHDGARPGEIARSCHIEAPTLTSILNRMERDGLIIRKAPPGNRRSLQICMTQKGKTLQKRIASEFASLEKEALQGLSDGEKEAFLKCMKTVYKNLQM